MVQACLWFRLEVDQPLQVLKDMLPEFLCAGSLYLHYGVGPDHGGKLCVAQGPDVILLEGPLLIGLED